MKHMVLPKMRRRNFLAYGSSGVLSLALTASGAGAWTGVSTHTRAAELVSVGYMPGSARLVREPMSASASVSSRLMAAEALPAGDPRFAHAGARVSIHGPFPDETVEMYPELALWAIDVEFKAAKCTPMFHAWCYQNTIVPQSSSPAPFVMPIVDALSLTLSLKRRPEGQTAASQSPARPMTHQEQARLQFSLGREAHMPKLQRGIYLIALPGAKNRALPRWSEYQLHQASPDHPNVETGLYRRHHAQVQRDFAYVKLVVDYADVASTTQV